MKKLFYFTVLLLSVSFISCEEEEPPTISGCTDSSATNYNSDATEDDGSCSYDTTSQSTSYNFNLFSIDPNITTQGTFYTNYLAVINGDTLNSNLNQHLSMRGNYDIVEDYGNNGTPYPTNGLSYTIEEGTSYNIQILDGLNDTEIISFDATITTIEDNQKYLSSTNLNWNSVYLDNKFTQGWDGEGTATDWMYAIENNFFLTIGIITY